LSDNRTHDVPSSHRDILEKAQIVTLATIGPDSCPQVTATWFVWEDDTLKLSLNSSRQKMKNLMQNPALTAFFVDPANPYRTIELRGTATIDEDLGFALAESIATKYGSNPREMDGPGEQRLAVRLDVKKVNTFGN
jgi:PPOX class probable F420-dependent enzyme